MSSSDIDLVFHRLRYFFIAATIAFLTLALISGFALRQAYRASQVPQINTHILCSSLYEMQKVSNVERSLPGECTDEVLNDHHDH